jgi:hypothetical protein
MNQHVANRASELPALSASLPASPPRVRPQSDDFLLLLIISTAALLGSGLGIAFGIGGSGLPLVLAGLWIPFFALAAGTFRDPEPMPETGRVVRPRKSSGNPPFQFGLSDLLCAVFVVAFLMGIIALTRDTNYRDESFVELWNFMSGSVLAVASALLISSWRTGDRSGWMVGTPIFLGTLAHMVFGLAADRYVLLAWGLVGFGTGRVGLWRCGIRRRSGKLTREE